MSSQQIIITVTDDGIKVETQGYSGSSCTDATKALEQALGTVQERQLKPEYYDIPHNVELQENWQ
jgi:hypothetical protein